MLNVLSLFSGIGGFDLGLERAGGFQTVAFCEQSPFCQDVLRSHWRQPPIYGDVRVLDNWELSHDDIPKINLICGGFPCQPFSTASRGRKIAVDLWPEMARLVRALRPEYVLAENVQEAAILNAKRDLEQCSYTCDVRCISATDCGADHSRDRWWLCAYTDVQSELYRFIHAEVAKLPALCAGLWGAENYAQAVRISHGVPDWVDETDDRPAIEALGNAVLPQIPEAYGRAINASRAARSSSAHGVSGPKGE